MNLKSTKFNSKVRFKKYKMYDFIYMKFKNMKRCIVWVYKIMW